MIPEMVATYYSDIVMGNIVLEVKIISFNNNSLFSRKI